MLEALGVLRKMAEDWITSVLWLSHEWENLEKELMYHSLRRHWLLDNHMRVFRSPDAAVLLNLAAKMKMRSIRKDNFSSQILVNFELL